MDVAGGKWTLMDTDEKSLAPRAKAAKGREGRFLAADCADREDWKRLAAGCLCFDGLVEG